MLEQVGTWSPRQWARVILVAVIVITLLVIVVRTLNVLVPFALGLLLGYVILPLVNRLQRSLQRFVQRRDLSRLLAIFIVYAAGLAVVAVFLFLLVPIIIRQGQQLLANIDEIIATIGDALAGLQQFLIANVPEQVRTLVQEQIAALPERLLSALGAAVSTVTSTLGAILGFVIVPFWLIYVLYDAGRLGRGALNVFPESAQPDIINLGHIFDDVVGAYVRGQLLVAAVIGTLTGLGRALVGVNFPALLGALTAVGDLIPTAGPFVAAIPTVIIAALERPILALWAILVLVGAQQFEGAFIEPRIIGTSVQLSPAVIIVLLVIAGDLAGIVGLLVVVPLTAFLRDVVRYVYLRTSPEPIMPAEALERVRRARGQRRPRRREAAC